MVRFTDSSLSSRSFVGDWLRPIFASSPSFFSRYLRVDDFFNLSSLVRLAVNFYSPLEDLSFFEFGSRHYSFPSFPPFSSAVSHLLSSSGTDYFCFDPGVDRSRFVSAMPVFKDILLKKGFRKTVDVDVDGVDCNSLSYWLSNRYSFFDDSFSMKMFANHLDDLLSSIDSSALSFPEMVSKIDDSYRPLIFSMNVLSYPESGSLGSGLDRSFPFWSIDKGFHVHLVYWDELIGNLDDSGEGFSNRSYGSLDEMISDGLKGFKGSFSIRHPVHYDVLAGDSSDNLLLALYWDTNK